MDPDLARNKVGLHPHAKARLQERGATEEEIISTIGRGERFSAKHGRTGFRCNGTVYGVELLNANEQLTGDQGTLIVESGGRRQKIPLVA